MESSQTNLIDSPILDEGKQIQAQKYSKIRRVMGLIETGVYLILLLVLVFGGVSKWFIGLFYLPSIALSTVYFVLLILFFELLTAPLTYYNGFVLPHHYGISIQKLKSWVLDLAKSSVLILVIGSGGVTGVFWMLSIFPEFWWLIIWGLMLAFSIFITIVAPVILIPLFYKVKPLEAGELKFRLEELAIKAGAKVRGIFTLDFSTKVTTANAGLMGMGKTRRIVVSDTLIKRYSPAEIEVITAHEIGHHLHKDLYRLFIVQSAIYLVGLKIVDTILKAIAVPMGFTGMSDPAILPTMMLILGVLSVLTAPLMNSYTRHIENQADEYALTLTSNSRAFIDSMTRLVNQNLAVASPPKWEEFLFHDHPSYAKRVEHAKIFEDKLSSKSLT
jgi:STE24 endopeptidase